MFSFPLSYCLPQGGETLIELLLFFLMYPAGGLRLLQPDIILSDVLFSGTWVMHVMGLSV